MNKQNIHELFKASLQFQSEEEKNEFEASVLSMGFLSIIDAEMREQKMSKKELAAKVGTSAAYITQLFMGDRLPNFKILAKMQKALGLSFKVSTEGLWEEELNEELMEYHQKWVKTQQYLADQFPESNYKGVLAVESAGSNNYALAS